MPKITKKDFLNRLAEQSEELGSLVERIKYGRKQKAEYQEQLNNFKGDPYQKMPDGSKRFIVVEAPDDSLPTGDFREDVMPQGRFFRMVNGKLVQDGPNLLDLFDDFDDVKQYLGEEFYVFDKQDDCFFWVSDKPVPYSGPRLHIFPDSNVEISRDLKRSFKNMCGEESIFYDPITIVRLESSPGGLRRRFKNRLPEELIRGQQSLEKRCAYLEPEVRQEVERFYDIIVEYFSSEINSIRQLSDGHPDCPPETIAKMHLGRDLEDSEHRQMLIKEIRNYRSGNLTNHVTDRVLSSTCFALNLLDPANKSIVVSQDPDMKYYFRVMYEEILPRFMADSALEAIKKRNPLILNLPGVKGKLLKSAKEHIQWAKNSGSDKTTVGILYSPKNSGEWQFHTYEVAEPFVQYFRNVEMYRIGKIQVLEGMLLTGRRCEEVVQKLMNQ